MNDVAPRAVMRSNESVTQYPMLTAETIGPLRAELVTALKGRFQVTDEVVRSAPGFSGYLSIRCIESGCSVLTVFRQEPVVRLISRCPAR